MVNIVHNPANGAAGLSFTIRVLLGALGGLAAILLKIYSQDVVIVGNFVLRWYNGLLTDKEHGLLFGYIVMLLVVIALGSIIGACVRESSPLKMLAIGISAPAMLTTYAGGAKVGAGEADNPPRDGASIERMLDEFSPVQRAYAQTVADESGQSASFADGIRVFFGKSISAPFKTSAGDGESVRSTIVDGNKYWVIAGSSSTAEGAEALAVKINQAVPGFEARAAEPKPGSEYYSVVLGGEDGYLPRAQAEELRSKAITSGAAPLDAFLSPYADRTWVE